MKIKRVVNGQEMEFELTGMELIQAYWEVEADDEREDLKSVFQDSFEDEETLSEAEFEQALHLFKKYRSNDDQWRYDAEDAINTILNERRNKQ